MNKIAIWLTTGMLLIYFVFTSGLYYWASRCEVTDEFITPFSWALNAENGFTLIATEGDINCVQWLLEESDSDLVFVCDSNGAFLFTGHMEVVPSVSVRNCAEKDRLEWINSIFTLDRCYLFLTDWNIRNRQYIECTDVGLRTHFHFNISDKGDGCLDYSADILKEDKSIVVKTVSIKEVYKSGNSAVYEKVE